MTRTEPRTATPAHAIDTFDAFWTFYLGEHTRPACRLLHYAGAAVGLFLMGRFVFLASTTCGICAIPAAYALAWIGHMFLEKNRPATWRYPFWSLAAEFRMAWCALTGRLRGEFESRGVDFGRS